MNALFDNPELKRNIWLELTPNRLISMPLVLAAIFYLIYLSDNNFYEFMERLRTTSVVAFGLIVFMWGTKLVAESVITEVNDKTWDSQRMTSVSPLDMTIGKLFGSALYTWYGGFFCAGAYLISALYLPDAPFVLKNFLITVLAAILGHAVSLNFSLMEIRKNREKEKIKTTFFVLVGLVLIFSLVSGFLVSGLSGLVRKTEHIIRWHSLNFSYSDFMLFSVLFFLIWSVIGVYRNMRTEFQMTSGPYVWLTFLISFMLYLSGFLSNTEDMEPVKHGIITLYISYAVGVFITYIMAFIEPKQLVEFRFLADKAKKGLWKDVGDNLPLWLITLGVTVILCVAVLILSLISTPIEIKGQGEHIPAFYALNVLCFMIRDISLLLYVNLKKDAKRADIATVVYLIILYGLVPSILGMSGQKNLLPIFIPIPMFESNFINGTLPILIQCAIIIFFLLNRWKARNAEYLSEPGFSGVL